MRHQLVLLFAVVFAYAGAIRFTAPGADGKYCIVIDASNVTATIKYLNQTTNVTESWTFAINSTGNISAKCIDTFNATKAQSITVEFLPDGSPKFVAANRTWSLRFAFTNIEKADKTFLLADYTLQTYPNRTGFNVSTLYSKAATTDVQAGTENGFRCSTTRLGLTGESTINFTGLRVAAFKAYTTGDFPPEQLFEQCPLDARTSDVVPIVVGACLAGLVIVVLVAYLVGRARAQRQGYASV